MTTFTAIALDPGGTTGWAYYRATKMVYEEILPEAKEVVEWYDEEWLCGQLGPGDHADDLLALLEQNHTAEYHVLAERFIPRPGKFGADQKSAPRYITIAEMFCRARDVPFHLQNVGQVKPFVKDAQIRKLGLWSPSHRHAMDAYRHLLFWLTTGPCKRVDLLKKGWK